MGTPGVVELTSTRLVVGMVVALGPLDRGVTLGVWPMGKVVTDTGGLGAVLVGFAGTALVAAAQLAAVGIRAVCDRSCGDSRCSGSA